MHNPELHALARIDWQFFCTFTFKSEGKSDGLRRSMFFALLRTQAKVWRVHFKRLLWCLRRESGEATAAALPRYYRGIPPSCGDGAQLSGRDVPMGITGRRDCASQSV